MALLLMAGQASATGPGGWDHLGDGGTAGTPALNGAVYALNSDRPSTLYVGGAFTAAGGVAGADHIASWNGTAWSALGSGLNGSVNAIAYDSVNNRVYAGGTFTNAGGDGNADFLAVWNGTSWASFCSPITATVSALQIIGRNLYVGGAFADGGGVASADRLVRCNLDTGASSSTVDSVAHEFSGSGIYALTADSNGTLYAGGGFTDLGGDPAADNVAYLDASGTGWHSMGGGASGCGCAVSAFVRSLTAVGTNVYVGTDATDVAGIAQADHVARWDGSAWSAVGSNAAGTDGWFPASAFIHGMANDGPNVYATGSFQNANGDPTADHIAKFDGSAWHAIGSNGAGNGPWIGNGLAVAFFSQRLYAGGNFTSAGGDTQSSYLSAYPGYYTLTVVRPGSGFGIIQGPGINCGLSCSASYPLGTVVPLSALVSVEARLTGWSGGGCTGTGYSCSVTMNVDTTVTATIVGIPSCSSIGGYTATGGEAKALQLECRDPEGHPITYSIVSGPSHGTLGALSADGSVTYTPTVGVTGYDQISYAGTAVDGVASPAFVSINVTDPGYQHAGDNVALAGKLTPSASGVLALGARNRNSFTVSATSVTVRSLSAVAAARGSAHKKVIMFMTSPKRVTIKAGKKATLKGRVKARQLAQLKRLRHVRVRITVVLKTPGGKRSTVTSAGTLRAPK